MDEVVEIVTHRHLAAKRMITLKLHSKNMYINLTQPIHLEMLHQVCVNIFNPYTCRNPGIMNFLFMSLSRTYQYYVYSTLNYTKLEALRH